MPPIKDATKRPTNLGEIIPPATPTAQNIPPVPPNPAGDPGLAIGSLGPAPALWTDPYSSMRQWKRNGVSQQRFPVLPTKANPQLNAAARGVAKNTVSAATVAAINANPPSGGVTSVGLTMPSIFVSPVSGSPITSAGTLAPAFTSEPTNSFFAGPVSINGSAPLDVVSPGGNNGATNLPNPQTFSQSVTTRSANDLVLYYLRGGGSSFITTPGWTNVIAGEELFKTTAILLQESWWE